MRSLPFREMVHKRFDPVCKGKLEADAVMGIIAIAEEYDITEEVEAFLRENPTATLREALDYTDDLAPGGDVPLEIVDDDELDDDWED